MSTIKSKVVHCDCELVSSIPGYSDVDVTIRLATGEEYLYTVSRNNENGEVIAADVIRYAPAEDQDYVDFNGTVPEEVAAKLSEVRPAAIALFPAL